MRPWLGLNREASELVLLLVGPFWWHPEQIFAGYNHKSLFVLKLTFRVTFE